MTEFRTMARFVLLATLGLGGSVVHAEPPAKQLNAPALARAIDQEVQRRLEKEKIESSSPADDAEFLRRVYLDLHGVIPPPEKVVAFLNSKDADKRAKVIDEVLASPRYGQNMADIWGRLLLGDAQNVTNKGVPKAVMTTWLEGPFNRNQPWNKIAYDLLTATGTVNDNGAVRFYLNGQNLASEPQRSLTDLTDSVSSLFLGVQVKCAQCHDHFLTPSWKKADYWGVAGFFSQVEVKRDPDYKGLKNGNLGLTDRLGPPPERKGEVPDGYKAVPPPFPTGNCWPTGWCRRRIRSSPAQWSTAPGRISSDEGSSTPSMNWVSSTRRRIRNCSPCSPTSSPPTAST